MFLVLLVIKSVFYTVGMSAGSSGGGMVMYYVRVWFLFYLVMQCFFVLPVCNTSKTSQPMQLSSKKSDWLSYERLRGSYRRPFSEQTADKFRMTHCLGNIAYDMFWVNVGLISW